MAAEVEYLRTQLRHLRDEFLGVDIISPSELKSWPFNWRPDCTFIWSPKVDGETVLLRAHLQFPPDFGTPFSKVISPCVEFTDRHLMNKSLLYRNAIPHTFPVDARRLQNPPFRITPNTEIYSYPWVHVCWHYPGIGHGEWNSWLDLEWDYKEGLVPVFETCCEWARSYLGWRELGEWLHGGVGHKPNIERIAHDRKTFRRHHLSSAASAAVAQ